MPKNKNALIRYKTIDLCLRNNFRKWTLDNLIDACSDALYEFEGKDEGVSKRTIQGDIQFMRSDGGYSAPIVVKERKYYCYEDSEFSIINSNLNETDLGRITEALQILKQFQGFNQFTELEGAIKKLESKVLATKSGNRVVIDFDNNEDLKGLGFLDVLYKAIVDKLVLKIYYQPYKYNESRPGIFHPYLLKEFNNRWYVVGFIIGKEIPVVFALDRIEKIIPQPDITFFEKEDFDAVAYFKNTIGVSVLNSYPTKIKIKLSANWAPYVLTKPLHHSQKVMEANDDYTIIRVLVHPNREFYAKIFAMGENAQVLTPYKLRKYMKRMIKNSFDKYDDDTLINETKKSEL